MIKVVYEELTRFVGEKPVPIKMEPGKKKIMMLVGIQGSGKTTTASKLAGYFQKRGLKTALICADTYRPGAYAQLQQLANRINVSVYGDLKAKDPVKVVREGLKQFSDKELIIIDTAGRHKEEQELIKEMKTIEKKIKPDEVIMVIDGTIGQQALIQAKTFHEATPIGSILVTKLDGSARGGGALSAVAATNAPIKFIGTGEKTEDIEPFIPSRFVGRLLGMGDLEGLLSRVTEAFDEEETAEIRDAFKKGKITLRHFQKQMEAANKQSSIGKLVSKIPGVSNVLGQQPNLEEESQRSMKRFLAICGSMTEEELDNARMIKGKRIQRIARGSGTSPQEVKLLLKQFNQMTKQFKAMRKMRGRRGGPQGGIPPGFEGF